MTIPSLSNFNPIISSSSNSTTSTSSSSINDSLLLLEELLGFCTQGESAEIASPTSNSAPLFTDLTVIAKINFVRGSIFPLKPYQGEGEDNYKYSSSSFTAELDRNLVASIQNPQKSQMTLIFENRNEDTQKLMQEMIETIGQEYLRYSSEDPINRPNEGIGEFYITPKQGLFTTCIEAIRKMSWMFGGCYFPEKETTFVIEGMKKSWAKVSRADAQIKKVDEIIDEAISPQLPRVIINIIADYDDYLLLLKKLTPMQKEDLILFGNYR